MQVLRAQRRTKIESVHGLVNVNVHLKLRAKRPYEEEDVERENKDIG